MTSKTEKPGVVDRFLNVIEVAGNKLPDPAVLFLALMGIVWLLSWPLSTMDFGAVHPVTGEAIVVDGTAWWLTSQPPRLVALP